jgi:hypothetical protein
MTMQWQTVAIPFAQGISPNSRARLLDLTKLISAKNFTYTHDNGPQKRFGHVAKVVKTSLNPIGTPGIIRRPSVCHLPYSLDNPDIPSEWLHGWGIITGQDISSGPPNNSTFEVSAEPSSGMLFGQMTRDNEVVSWDSHRLYSYSPEQPQLFGEATKFVDWNETSQPAVMPAMNAYPYAKSDGTQNVPDFADSGTVKTAAWLVGAPVQNKLAWHTSDSLSGSLLNSYEEILNIPRFVRVITCGSWTHILISDTGISELLMRSFHQDTPNQIISRSLGTCGAIFDVKKYTESTFVVAKLSAGIPEFVILNFSGNVINTFIVGTDDTIVSNLAFAIYESGEIGFTWISSINSVLFKMLNMSGAVLSPTVNAGFVFSIRRITISDEYLTDSAGQKTFRIFVENWSGVSPRIQSIIVKSDGSPAVTSVIRNHMVLASHAFRVGQRAYVWGAVKTPLQSTWYLLDQKLLPVGKLDFGLANINDGSSIITLPSVNWRTLDSMHPAKDRFVFSGCLPYRQRVESSNKVPQPNGVFSEPSIRAYKLDFIPRLRSAQAGRCTYIAGAQLWVYDGASINEAVFHMAPEGTTYAAVNSGGALEMGVYRYRIDLCRKNAQNEEVRSWSIISDEIEVSGLNNAINIALKDVPVTRTDDSYFLIFRTEANGTEFYLVSSRDPSDASLTQNRYVANNHSGLTYAFTDGMSSATIIDNEYHPGNAGDTWLEPLPAPACEIVAAGRKRLWLAGGELAPGEVAPSRLFTSKDAPAFSPALNIEVDRSVEPINAIGFAGDICAIFRQTSTHLLDGDGPSNTLDGNAWPDTRLALTDTGAVGPECIANTTEGLFFQAPAGIRLLSAGGALVDGVGNDVDPIASSGVYSSAVVDPINMHIRFYSYKADEASLVYDYKGRKWVTWTGVECVGATYWKPGRQAILTRQDGKLYIETEGRFIDEDRTYEAIVQTAWLRPKDLGDFFRFRRFALFGLSQGSHTLRTRVFYDERPFHSQELQVNVPGIGTGTFNTSLWGDSIWGNGSWGDSNNQNGEEGLWFRDGTYRYRKMVQRQKCSVFSLEFSDLGAQTASFVPIALAIEIGLKNGLDRVPQA